MEVDAGDGAKRGSDDTGSEEQVGQKPRLAGEGAPKETTAGTTPADSTGSNAHAPIDSTSGLPNQGVQDSANGGLSKQELATNQG